MKEKEEDEEEEEEKKVVKQKKGEKVEVKGKEDKKKMRK